MSRDVNVLVVGTGFSGIAVGALLKEAGIDTFTILEKADDIGGTWRDNTYPGAACDIPSHLYSFSFAPKADWTYSFSPQGEIQAYLRDCIEAHDLKRHIHFGSRVTGGAFDAGTGRWKVDVHGREPQEADVLVLGNGALHIPSWPDIEGLYDFEGERFHSARWNHDYPLDGKRVAVIGTGASAIQFVPQIAPRAARLTVFQRTPPWIIPKPDRRMATWEKRLFARAPWIHRAYRSLIYAHFESRAIPFVLDPELMKLVEKLARRYLCRVVKDPELRDKLTPSYRMGCKRVLLSNDYYPALTRENVDVVTDPITRVTHTGVETASGSHHEVDAIICGTGYRVSEYLAPFALEGRRGELLNDTLHRTRATYLGICVRDFPNLFLMAGPNTGLGHNSMVFMIEAQARYAVQAVKHLRARPGTFMDVRADVQAAFNEELQRKMAKTVWQTGCSSWYLQDGHNMTLWPGFTFDYWWRTRRLRLADFEIVPAGYRSTRTGDEKTSSVGGRAI